MPKRSTSTTTTLTVRFRRAKQREGALRRRMRHHAVGRAGDPARALGRVDGQDDLDAMRACAELLQMPGPTNLIRPAFLRVAFPDCARHVRR